MIYRFRVCLALVVFTLVQVLGCVDTDRSDNDGGHATEDAGSSLDADTPDSDDGGTQDADTPDSDGGETQDAESSEFDGDVALEERTAVVIDSGPLVGTVVTEGAVAFLGIPFAAPPLGDLRFRAPQPVEPWTEPRAADTFAPACLQPVGEEEVRGDEDCLYLNVWIPPEAAESPRPVLVFIHGGGNVTGSAAEETAPGFALYDGAYFAARDEVIVVTIQYRLNAFGYLADPSLDGEAPSGNYGPRDMVAALQWVQRNIGAFGGDPDRVLLFGESGGAADVCGLLAIPTAADTFAAAAIMSGGCDGHEREGLLMLGEQAAEALGCDVAADRAECLRTADANALLQAVRAPVTMVGAITTWAGPTVDGVFLPESPDEAIAGGRHNRVPVVVGTTADETSSQLFGIPFGLSDAEYEARVRGLFPLFADAVLARYPREDFRTAREALVQLTTDFQFTCPTIGVAESLAANQTEPVFHYIYDHTYEGESPGAIHPRIFGAAHGFELPLLFQTLETYEGYVSTDAERALGREMAEFWTSFAGEGEPSASGSSSIWPRFSAAAPDTMVASTESSVVRDYRAEQCDWWLRR